MYGAYIYDTLWRIVAPVIIFPVLLVLTFSFQNKILSTKKIYQNTIFLLVVLFLWIIPIGFMEGGYGHLLKNLMFFRKANTEELHKMFPPEFGKTRFFENPNDYFFEITGVFQFIAGLYTFYFLFKFSKEINKKIHTG